MSLIHVFLSSSTLIIYFVIVSLSVSVCLWLPLLTVKEREAEHIHTYTENTHSKEKKKSRRGKNSRIHNKIIDRLLDWFVGSFFDWLAISCNVFSLPFIYTLFQRTPSSNNEDSMKDLCALTSDLTNSIAAAVCADAAVVKVDTHSDKTPAKLYTEREKRSRSRGDTMRWDETCHFVVYVVIVNCCSHRQRNEKARQLPSPQEKKNNQSKAEFKAAENE